MTGAPCPELVIFDCDGVLVDSEVISCRVDAVCLGEVGFATTAEEVMDRYVGISAATMFADLEARHERRLPEGFSLTLHDRLALAFESELRAVDGVETVVQTLAQRMCVASSSTPERLRHSLSLVGLLGHFEPNVFSASQVARGKPAPDLFLFAARQMNTAPAACLVIEDSVAGVQAAVAAGMPVFGFTGGGHCGAGHAERLRAAGAAATFQSMDLLPALI